MTSSRRTHSFDDPRFERLVERVRALPPEAGGLRPGEGLVVGFSGGADSTLLLEILVRLAPERGLRLVAAHLDHGLRPTSAEELEHCRRHCAARGVPFVGLRADVGRRAARRGENLEAAGRHARRALFAWVRRRLGLDRVATAHHLDDQVETLVLWTLRGAGLRGATGIRPATADCVRPLRGVRRAEIEEVLHAIGSRWIEDPSNRDTRARRSRLRHEVLPRVDHLLGTVMETPDWATRLDALSRRAAADRAALDELVADRLVSCTRHASDAQRELDLDALRSMSEVVLLQVLRAAIGSVQRPGPHQRWNEARLRDVLLNVRTGRRGQRWPLPGGGWMDLEKNRLILRGPVDEQDGMRPNGAAAQAALISELLPAPRPGFSFSEPGVAWFDAARVSPPFTLRAVQPGDRIRPYGMRGHKKVAKLLSERAVPRDERAGNLVVTDTDRILWIVGITTSESARVSDSTEQVWRLRVRTPADPFPGSTP